MPRQQRKSVPSKINKNHRVIVERVFPEIDGGRFPIKRTRGETVDVEAHVYTDGHDGLAVFLLFRRKGETRWTTTPMVQRWNDEWLASFAIEGDVDLEYTVQGFIDHFGSWQHGLEKKIAVGQDIAVDLKIGAEFMLEAIPRASVKVAKQLKSWAKTMQEGKNAEEAKAIALGQDARDIMRELLDPEQGRTYKNILCVSVERQKAAFSSWYEFFPRSATTNIGRHGTFNDCEALLPDIAKMGFDVVYLPPIHPIGAAHRKGKNNSTVCASSDPGCPWAIGSEEGGHKSIHSQLGTLSEFRAFVKTAASYSIDVAIDVAFQCSPDHPYVKEHPQWFLWRPDGTVQYAENPPKKYEDVLPFNFDTEDREALWTELRSIFLFWIEQGVTIFRVDNPHTKPFEFWDWVITSIRADHPEAIFLAEAFTRPKIMYRLAKGGFTQSYTYFTWRNTKQEFIEYLTELTKTEAAEFFRPNFWPNTPDILPVQLQEHGRPAFIMRTVLAGTLSSNYGVYGPAFELCVNAPLPGREEYLDSEKYEIKLWDHDGQGNIKDVISRVNQVRRDNPALHSTRNIHFVSVDSEHLLCYYKATKDLSNIILIAVNLDPTSKRSGVMTLPLEDLGVDLEQTYVVKDLLNDKEMVWNGAVQKITLDPQSSPAQIFLINKVR